MTRAQAETLIRERIDCLVLDSNFQSTLLRLREAGANDKTLQSFAINVAIATLYGPAHACRADHKTEAGARRWAEKILNRHYQ